LDDRPATVAVFEAIAAAFAAMSAVFVPLEAVLAAIADPVRMKFYILEGIEPGIDDKVDGTAITAIAPVGPSARHEFFAPKTGAASTARPTTGEHAGTIDKHNGTAQCAALLGGRVHGTTILAVHHVDALLAFLVKAELYDAVFEREERIVSATANVIARGELSATLAYEDVAGDDVFAPKLLDTQPLCMTVAAVPRATACFLVRHGSGIL